MREIGVRAGLLLLSVLSVLAIAELAVRLSDAAPRAGRVALIQASSHPELDYVMVPGAVVGKGSRVVSINSLGLRDREVSASKPPGVRRILAIGDSITFGMGVGAEESYPKQLEALLDGSEPPTEVLNLGVGGYDVVNEVALLEELGPKLGADTVVLGLCINDVGIHSAHLRLVERARPWSWLLARSHLARFLLQRIERRLLGSDLERLNAEDEFARRNAGRIEPLAGDEEQLARMAALAAKLDPAPRAGFADWYTSAQKIGRLRWAFSKLATLASVNGFEVIVAILPYLDEGGRSEIYRRVYEISAHEARRAGFRVLVLRDAFVAHGLATLRRGPGDPLHPNARGHAIIAEAFYEALRPD
ncbi:MAG: GDSL-type esterase/lipase family protein [Myxococcota bacterium]|nr:GDSL-type esterase/lipase family protein [Myxococcota bacterium]